MASDKKPLTRGGEVCVPLADGSFCDAALHEAIMARVNDSDLNLKARTRAKLLATGVPVAVLDRVLPEGVFS